MVGKVGKAKIAVIEKMGEDEPDILLVDVLIRDVCTNPSEFNDCA